MKSLDAPAEATGPRRIQLRRTKGWRKPEGAIYVGRASNGDQAGRWGNPFRITDLINDGVAIDVEDGRAIAVELFRSWLAGTLTPDERGDLPPFTGQREWILGHLHLLAGKTLACWCPSDQPCHADVLLELANADRAVTS